MFLDLSHINKISGSLTISGSKSESNRALLLQKFFPNLTIQNLSDSDDTHYLKKALENNSYSEINIGHAGTAMRFLTAYLSVQKGKTTVITGSDRMKERPIKVLVDALRDLGAEIEYIENEGFPPLKIKGKNITNKNIFIPANVSSQYISALLLIAPSLENGLEINLIGEISSLSYLQMTLSLLDQVGVKNSFINRKIKVEKRTNNLPISINIESDWSSASYFYSFIALSNIGSRLQLSRYKKDSIQGDSIVAKMYQQFGVQSTFFSDIIIVEKVEVNNLNQYFEADFTSCPDLAQTVAVTCFGLGINAHLTGLHTLKIKETDRLLALKNELEKLGAVVEIDDKTLKLFSTNDLKQNVLIKTYNDHRMAMAFAPLSLKVPLQIENPEVVTKSYRNFWNDINQLTNNSLQ